MKQRVLFIGCVDFSKALLLQVLKNDLVEICGLITKRQSADNSDHCDLSLHVGEFNIPTVFYDDGYQEMICEFIRDVKPDAIYCFGWSHLLGPEILALAPLGCIGYHPTLLPNNRGRHPIIWALVLGLSMTGSTFFLMDEGADTGNILSQCIVDISLEDDALSLYNKLQKIAKNQMIEIDRMVSSKMLCGISQPKSKGNSWRKRSKKDGHIDFRMTSIGIFNLVRALRSPYPGAYVEYSGDNYIIDRVILISNDAKKYEYAEPGKVLEIVEGKIFVKCGDGIIALTEHTIPNFIQKGEYLL